MQDLYSFKKNSLPYEIPKFGLNQTDIEQDTSYNVFWSSCSNYCFWSWFVLDGDKKMAFLLQ